jgi:hypothetical protein
MISGLGVVLAVTNAITAQNDVRMATGTVGDAQKRFFVEAADRPDIAIFFKGLAPDQRLKMSQSVGEYDDPKIAVLIGKLLADFDFVAREALTDSLVKLVKKQPKAVAEQLALKGSFQQLAVAKALATLGPTSAPFAAATLTNADAKPVGARFAAATEGRLDRCSPCRRRRAWQATQPGSHPRTHATLPGNV